MLKKTSSYQPHIGHMKEEGKLRTNFLKGFFGDKIHAILCGVGHNLRFIFRQLSQNPVFTEFPRFSNHFQESF
jgi:transposase, IS5 family